MNITSEQILELVSYDPLTGFFTWKEREDKKGNRTFNSRFANKRAGGIDRITNYRYIMVDGIRYLEHRLVYLVMTGVLPPKEIDHINHDREDNSWENLRLADRTSNGRNRSMNCDNTSGVNGVCWDRANNQWKASIRVNLKLKHLGTFSDYFEAICCRKAANIKYGFHKNHGT